MAHCVERHGIVWLADDRFTHDDRPTTYEKLEAVVGRRLDRRKNYALIEGRVAELVEWTNRCSGCEGTGCNECGGTGKRRLASWVPL